MNIADKRVVSIHYTLTAADGELIDRSADGEPLVYLHGAGNLIPGLEDELTGKAAGDALKVVVAPEQGYGMPSDELVQRVPREAFGGIEELQPGMRFEATDQQGNAHPVVIQEIDGDEVVVNGNHPLAGHTLHFDVTVAEVREATAEELEHGHAHADGHHHH